MKCAIGYFLVLLLFSNSLCEECVTYNFEEDFDTQFSSQAVICTGLDTWTLSEYTSLDLEGPHNLSTVFISPSLSTQSCVSSFNFPMPGPGGKLEVNVYMETAQPADFINIFIMDANGFFVMNSLYTMLSENFKPGWNTVQLITEVPGGVGFIVLMGVASVDSVVLVDSFRYIPPSLTEEDEECALYIEDTDSGEGDSGVTVPPTTDPDESEEGGDPGVTVPPTTDPDESEEGGDPGVTVPPSTNPEESEEGGDAGATEPGEDVIITPIPSFWNPLTISMVAVISAIALFIICMIFYQIGKRSAEKDVPLVVIPEVDYNKLPKTITVPRVTSVYENGFNTSRNSTFPV